MNDQPKFGALSTLAVTAARVLSLFERYGLEVRVDKILGVDMGETVIHIRLNEPKRAAADVEGAAG